MHRPIVFSLVLFMSLAAGACAPTASGAKRVAKKPEKETKETVVEPPPNSPVKDRIKLALDAVQNRPVNIQHNFWTVFHAILGMGFDTQLIELGPNKEVKKRVKAIDYIRTGGEVPGLKFVPTNTVLGPAVDVETRAGTGVYQGHQDQFVAEMAQWGLPPETDFLVDGRKYKFSDFHLQSKMRASVKKNQELSWAILIIAQYFGTDHAWTNNDGDKLTLEDVVRYELDQPVDKTAACGGTHRLFGFTWAYHLHRRHGGRKEGVWKEAADRIDQYKWKAKDTQNKDFAWVNYLDGREDGEDLGSWGHVVEWLSLSMTKEELEQGWVEDAAANLAMALIRKQHDPLESGALYHAAHGLHIYYNRRWGPLGSDPVIPAPPKD